jgi:anti-sigma regulatory factor (Ser/Thr protein kinase)
MNATSHESAALNREYAGDAVTLRSARHDVVAWLNQHQADSDTIEQASLIVSELASNAIQAAPGISYQLRLLRVGDDFAELSVTNRTSGTHPPSRNDRRLADASALRGRGLSIVDSLSDEVTIETVAADVVVTARFRVVQSP